MRIKGKVYEQPQVPVGGERIEESEVKANIIRTTPAFQKAATLVFVAILAMTIFLGGAQPASAAGYQYYCCVNVQAGAAARYDPWVANYNLAGWVTPDRILGWTSNTQKSYVTCYEDGGWATGNYRSNRWFLVYVHITNGTTSWYYVHSSYVYNQITVPRC